jgi:AcrR family transcriptional regulator
MESGGDVSTTHDGRRKYDSSRRQADAEARHRRIVQEAEKLFLDKGFAATSIGQIAEAAEVSSQTIYSTFGSKAGVLSRVYDFAMVGDFDETPIRERMPGFAGVRPERYRDVFAEHAVYIRAINERVAALLRVLEQSASIDPALAELRADLVSRFRSDCETWVDQLEPGALRPGLTPADAAAVMALIISPTAYSILTVDAGWSADRYQRWLAETEPMLLLKPELLAD